MAPTNKTYRDFDLLITSENGQFFGQVLSSPAGAVSKRTPLEFSLTDNDVLKLENALLRSSTPIRSGGKGAQKKVIEEFGGMLFSSAIESSEDISQLYHSSRALVRAAVDERLRLKLRIQAPELAQLPWEFMYDKRGARDYVTFKVPIARYLDSTQPANRSKVHPPLRILGMVADPGDRDPNGPWEKLATDDERHRIDEGIAELQKRGEVDFQWVPGGTQSDLVDMVERHGPWHIFHFIGHGGAGQEDEDDEGFIVLEDEQGRGVEMSATKLVRILGDSDLRLAVLNCCESARGTSANPLSSPGASLVQAGLSSVVAMQFPISDQAAIKLAAGFYGELVRGLSVDAAVRRARLKMTESSEVEWGIPVLYTRSADGILFSRTTAEGAGAEPAVVVEVPNPGPAHAPADVASEGVDEAEPINLESSTAADFLKFGENAQRRAELLDTELEAMSEPGLRAFIESARSIIKRSDEELKKKTAAAHFRLARLRRKSNMKDAFVHYNAAIELNPNRIEYYHRLANVKAMLGQHDSALADVDSALEIDGNMAELHWTRGLLHTLLAEQDDAPQHLAEALSAFTEAIRLDPKNGRYHDSRSTVYTQLARYEEAIRDLSRVIELDPENRQAYRRRGMVRERAGDAQGAAEDFGRAAGGGGPA